MTGSSKEKSEAQAKLDEMLKELEVTTDQCRQLANGAGKGDAEAAAWTPAAGR